MKAMNADVPHMLLRNGLDIAVMTLPSLLVLRYEWRNEGNDIGNDTVARFAD